jgi:hypothetical protein
MVIKMAKIDTLEVGVKITNCKDCDRVEVVRCKDCKHYYHGTCSNDFALNLMRENDYCSYGKRLEADGDKNG